MQVLFPGNFQSVFSNVHFTSYVTNDEFGYPE